MASAAPAYLAGVTECVYDTCKAGFCKTDDTGIYCDCLEGFTGDICDTKIDQCATGPCDPGLECQDLINTWACVQVEPLPESENSSGDGGLSTWIIILITCIAVIFLCAAWVAIYIHFDRKPINTKVSKPVKKQLSTKLKAGVNVMAHKNTSKYEVNRGPKFDLLRKKWEIPESSIEVKSLLDSGEYAKVFTGFLKQRANMKKVALKRAKDNVANSPLVKTEIVNEFECLATLTGHDNIVTMLGVVFMANDEVTLVLELCTSGNLHDVLLGLRDVGEEPDEVEVTSNGGKGPLKGTGEQLVDFAIDICRGMRFIAKNGYVFRDLACRNVLLGNDRKCKICDFGLAKCTVPIPGEKAVEMTASVHQNPLLWRWLAPESIESNTYSTKTDVWQFGLCMWELVTLAAVPYPHYSNRDVLTAILDRSYKMPKPLHCSNEWYTIMTSCWSGKTNIRPSFQTLYTDLRNVRTTGKGFPAMHAYRPENYLPVTPVQ